MPREKPDAHKSAPHEPVPLPPGRLVGSSATTLRVKPIAHEPVPHEPEPVLYFLILRRYLLGVCTPEETKELDLAVADERMHPMLEFVEDKLIEDYISGVLNEPDRSRFEGRLLLSHAVVEKIHITANLMGRHDVARDLRKRVETAKKQRSAPSMTRLDPVGPEQPSGILPAGILGALLALGAVFLAAIIVTLPTLPTHHQSLPPPPHSDTRSSPDLPSIPKAGVYQTAGVSHGAILVLDLRDPRLSVETSLTARSAASVHGLNGQTTLQVQTPLQVPRTTKRLILLLPAGSKEGNYDIALFSSTGVEVLRFAGKAERTDHPVTLVADADLGRISPGAYLLGVRQPGLGWTQYRAQLF